MSSGAYVYRPTYRDKINANLERLEVEESNLSKLFHETMKEINLLKETLSNVQKTTSSTSTTETSVSMEGLLYGDSREVASGLSTDNLIFAEIDTTNGDIIYISLDYSEVLSISGAVNSSEYKKMKLANEINRCVMLLPIDSEKKEKEIIKFLELLNTALDDINVDFDFFNDYIVKRFELIKTICIPDKLNIESDEWKEYCALCILVGQKPKFLSGVKLQDQIFALKQSLLENKYLDEAKKALNETLSDLGFSITEEFSLEGIEGVIVDSKESDGYRFFVSEQKDSFIFEMVEDTSATPSSKVEMCKKRKEIARIMEQKGFPLDVLNENDCCVSSKVLSQKHTSKNSIIEKTRAKRVIAGKKPHAKMIGR